MPPIVSLIGRPNCGKTTLLEKLIPALLMRGVVVGTIKHHVHGTFTMDVPGKDSFRHKQAGARTVVLSSPTGVGMTTDCRQDTPLAELLCRYFFDIDLVLAEGYKQGDSPKIEVFRKELHDEPLPDSEDGSLIAMVTDDDTGRAIPCFSPADPEGLADFLVERFVGSKKNVPGSPRVTMIVDGRIVPLSDEKREILLAAVSAMPIPEKPAEEIVFSLCSGPRGADGK